MGYAVSMILATTAGIQQVNFNADHVLTDLEVLGSVVMDLPPGASCLYLNPGPALAVTISHLDPTPTEAPPQNGHDTSVDVSALLAAGSMTEGGN